MPFKTPSWGKSESTDQQGIQEQINELTVLENNLREFEQGIKDTWEQKVQYSRDKVGDGIVTKMEKLDGKIMEKIKYCWKELKRKNNQIKNFKGNVAFW